MSISVIIPCYNMGDTLSRAVQSVLHQCDEVIIVDDGSSERTLHMCRLIERMAFASVSVLYQDNRGVCAARNRAISLASGDYILPLDADDYMYQNGVSTLAKEARPDRFVYGGCIELPLNTPRPAPPIGMITRKNVANATFLFPREAWATVGGYDEDFEHTGAEDYAFMLSLLEKGYTGVCVPSPVYYYTRLPGGRNELPLRHRTQIFKMLKEKYPGVMYGR